MPKTPATVLAMLADSVPNPPYVRRPTHAELLDALRYCMHDPQAGQYFAVQAVTADEAATAWHKRHTALRLALVSHYAKAGEFATSCHCASCRKWRPEFETLHAAKKAAHQSDDAG